MSHLFQAQIVAYSAVAARHPGYHQIKSPVRNSSRGELRNEIRGVNMFLPLHNKVSVNDNT